MESENGDKPARKSRKLRSETPGGSADETEIREEMENQIENEINNPQEKEDISTLEEEELLKDTEDPPSTGNCSEKDTSKKTGNDSNTESQKNTENKKSNGGEKELAKSSENAEATGGENYINFEEAIPTENEDTTEDPNAVNPLDISGSDAPEEDSETPSKPQSKEVSAEQEKKDNNSEEGKENKDVNECQDEPIVIINESSKILDLEGCTESEQCEDKRKSADSEPMEVDDSSAEKEIEGKQGDSGRPVIVPRAFASLNSQKEQSKLITSGLDPTDCNEENTIDPFLEHGDDEQAELITGDKSLAAETLLLDPEVDLCVIDRESGGHKVVLRENLREEHPYATPSTSSGSTEDGSKPESPAPPPSQTPRKKLKVMYPKKKKDPNGSAVVQVQPVLKTCIQCCKTLLCSLMIQLGESDYFLCSDNCLVHHRATAKSTLMKTNKCKDANEPVQRFCSECTSKIAVIEKALTWQTMDYCAEDCLAKHLNQLGSKCASCHKDVSQVSLGKYCVRLGQVVRQFCCSNCLADYKKLLKVCSYCQCDISAAQDCFLAPIGEKGTFKDFCTQDCMEKYDCLRQNQPMQLCINMCDVCDKQKLVQVEVLFNSKVYKLCSDVCFAAFKFVNSLTEGFCDMCKKYFNKPDVDNWQIIWNDKAYNFCTKNCMNIYILSKRKIVSCCWCKVKKYNFDMVKKTVTVSGNTGSILGCSLNCLALYQVSIAVTATKKIVCDKCKKLESALYHLTMSDATIRNFCSYQCVLDFQYQFKKRLITLPSNHPTPTGTPKRILPKMPTVPAEPIIGGSPGSAPLPVISSVGTLAKKNGSNATGSVDSAVPKSISVGSQVVVKHQVIVRPPATAPRANKMTQAFPKTSSKGVACKPLRTNKSTQTDDPVKMEPVLIPVPVPIYVPVPLAMYSIPVPTPMPFPLPIPVPVFVPTTRNSAKGIMKEIKRIQDQIPVDPFEAELLMMAEMVASDKKDSVSSDSEPDSGQNNQNSGSVGREVSSEVDRMEGGEELSSEGGGGGGVGGGGGREEDGGDDDVVGDVEGAGGFGDDVIQMALKMATELEEQQPDLDLPPPPPINTNGERESSERGKKREHGGSGRSGTNKRIRRSSPQPAQEGATQLHRPKPDANMCLKRSGLQYTLGVNAWKHWVMEKNAELEKRATPMRKPKLLKTDVLQLSADELNYALGLFVKEAKKPSGEPYSSDTIYYLCLGIQQHLFQNGRIDNIFMDTFYDKFTDRLDEVTRVFGSFFEERPYVETRIQEEHLWETKQLGAHSPFVLLSTLMYFNTKFFNLTSVDEHMQLSFSHIMKNWKRSGANIGAPQGSGAIPTGASTPKTPGGPRNVLLRFYPPQSSTNNDADSGSSKKKKVYEQQENEVNPLRCPVRLYEFYLLKCPDSVRSRNDVFYLQPERSCVGDSPVWYSTSPLTREPLSKMLNRIKMVKEVNLAILSAETSQ